MKADIDLSETKFDEICKLLMKDANRPVTVIMLLDLPLSTNLAGDFVNRDRICKVKDFRVVPDNPSKIKKRTYRINNSVAFLSVSSILAFPLNAC